MKRKVKIWVGVVLPVIVLGVVVWNILFSTTQIAFVNHQVITLGQIAKSNDNDRIKLSILDVEELDEIGKYDAVLINGMGLRITAEQRAMIQDAADNGVCVITTMATNPANEIIFGRFTNGSAIKGYLNGGGRRNYRNMLTYIRRNIDGKTIDTEEPDAPVKREQKQFYHIDPSAPEDEEVDFGSVTEYEAFLKKHNLLKANVPVSSSPDRWANRKSW